MKQSHKSITDEFSSRRFAIYILGAGFSAAAGLPLAPELWSEVRRRARARSGRAAKFQDDLEFYIRYRRECDGTLLSEDDVNFEDFVAFLDVEHYLGWRGKDTWSSAGNEAQVVIKTLIGEILTETTPSKDRIPDIYLKFAKLLKPPDIVLTFNYDVLLERALEATGTPFRLFPDRYRRQASRSRVLSVDDSKEEVVVLKLHGSVDWFDRADFDELRKDASSQGFNPAIQRDMLFSNTIYYRAASLVDGARSRSDALRRMYRVRNIEQLYRDDPMFKVTPSLLSPSSAKLLYSEAFKRFWWGLGSAGHLNFSMGIIGYSMPPQDDYARQIIYRLVKNYLGSNWGEPVLEHTKTPLALIDYRLSSTGKDDFRRRYAFVDWTKTALHFDGFGESALRLLGG